MFKLQYPSLDLDRIRTLDGEFRSSRGEDLIHYVVEIAFIAMGGYLGASYFDGNWLAAVYFDANWPLVAVALAFVAGTWFFLIRRNGIWYKFDHGSLSAYARDGAVLWREDLGGLTRASRNWGYFPFLVLRWPDHRRLLQLYNSLDDALWATALSAPSRDGSFKAARATAMNDPEQKPWRCGSCGEENPGAFEICWKCEKPRTELG